MKQTILISDAEKIAKLRGFDQIIIIGRVVGDAGFEHVTTYGKNAEHCSAAAKIGDFLKYRVMGWPRGDA
jgi:hypothetical protein